MLINGGADIDVQSNNGDTALVGAEFFEHTQIVEMLKKGKCTQKIQEKTDQNNP